jgi:hypothetical protein
VLQLSCSMTALAFTHCLPSKLLEYNGYFGYVPRAGRRLVIFAA